MNQNISPTLEPFEMIYMRHVQEKDLTENLTNEHHKLGKCKECCDILIISKMKLAFKNFI